VTFIIYLLMTFLNERLFQEHFRQSISGNWQILG